MSLTQLAVTFSVATGAVTLVGAACGGLRFLLSAVEKDRIAAAFTRTDGYLCVAARLDEIGEHDWAQERRRDARLDLLRRLVQYESNRARSTRTTLEALAYVSYFLGMVLMLAHAVWLPAALLAILCLAFALVMGGCLAATRPRVQRLISAEVERRYENIYGPINASIDASSGTATGPFAGTVNRSRFHQRWQERRRTQVAIQRRARRATKGLRKTRHDNGDPRTTLPATPGPITDPTPLGFAVGRRQAHLSRLRKVRKQRFSNFF